MEIFQSREFDDFSHGINGRKAHYHGADQGIECKYPKQGKYRQQIQIGFQLFRHLSVSFFLHTTHKQTPSSQIRPASGHRPDPARILVLEVNIIVFLNQYIDLFSRLADTFFRCYLSKHHPFQIAGINLPCIHQTGI